MTEQNTLGKEVTRDYTTGVLHVREQLEEIDERRKRCNDLVDVRKLKLQQMLQLFTCEQDGEQVRTIYRPFLLTIKLFSLCKPRVIHSRRFSSLVELTAVCIASLDKVLTGNVEHMFMSSAFKRALGPIS